MASSLPPTNRPLSNAMVMFQHEPGTGTARALYEALLGATLVLLEREDTPEVVTDIAFGGRTHHFRFLKGSGGRVAIPAFTDPQAMLLRYPEGGTMYFTPAVELAQALAGSTRTIVLNPTQQQPSGIHIPRMAVAAIAEGRVPEQHEQG